jgi:Domain of unknown function (DUF4440)
MIIRVIPPFSMKRILLSLTTFAIIAAGVVQRPAIAQQQTQQPPLIAEFQKIEDQWSGAQVKQDQFTLETILSPTFVNLTSAGDITTRNQLVATMYEKGVPQPMTMEQRVVNVRVIEDVAIVDGTYIQRTKLNGAQREERGLFTHVYQHVRGNWVCVQSQRTAVIEQGNEKKKAENKKSNAELPFHIPIFHKGADSSANSTPDPTPASTQQPSSQPAPQS